MRRMWRWFDGLRPFRQALVVLGLFLTLIIVGSTLASLGGGSSSNIPAAPATSTNTTRHASYHYINDADGFQCRSDKTDKHSLCPENPDYGKTAAELHAEAVAVVRAAKKRSSAD